MKSICNIHEIGFDVAVGCHYCRGVAEEKAVEFDVLEPSSDLREYVDDAGRRLANGHPFAGLSKLIDEVTEEGPAQLRSTEPGRIVCIQFPPKGLPSPSDATDQIIASYEADQADKDMVAWQVEQMFEDEEMFPSPMQDLTYAVKVVRAVGLMLIRDGRDWDYMQVRLNDYLMMASKLLNAAGLNVAVEEPLSTAITTYACGPLKPGERHEARVVASKGCVDVYCGRPIASVTADARDPKNGNALMVIVSGEWRTGDFVLHAVDHRSGKAFDGDVVIEFAVVAT